MVVEGHLILIYEFIFLNSKRFDLLVVTIKKVIKALDYITSMRMAPKEKCLEVQLGEEPLVLTSLVSFFKGLLDNLLGFFTLRWFFESFGGDHRLEGLNVQSVSGWQQVVVVDNLDERLDLGSLGDLFSTLSLGDLQWVSLNTSDQGVAEWVRLGTLIVWLDDHNLLTSVTTADNDSY